MPYEITYLKDDDVVFTEYIAPVTLEDLGDVIARNMELGASTGSQSFLGDCRSLPAADSPLDTYELATTLDTLGVDRRMREALVIAPDPEIRESFKFFETVTSNRGIKVRLFDSIETAMAWLKHEQLAAQER